MVWRPNSADYCAVLRKAGVPVELHVSHRGGTVSACVSG
jgi:hypothetical protein